MSKRDYEISRKAGDKMWTCKVTNRYGETHTNYFETERQCREHIYYTIFYYIFHNLFFFS